MNKSTRILAVLFLSLSLCFAFTSCLSDDNNKGVQIDEEWKSHNEQVFRDKKATGEYSELIAPMYATSNLYILAKPSSEMAGLQDRAFNYDVVEFTDSVYCRYTGWYIKADGQKYIFDSTEVPVGNSLPPNSKPRSFLVGNVVEGWRTALYNMKVGDELEIVIPQNLGYGASASSIPAYTTLFFNMKLTKLVKMKGQK